MTISVAQRRIIQNGLGIILIGLIGGFFLAWNVIEVITFPLLPFTVDYQIPGRPARWRAVHSGNIMNGIMALALAYGFNYCDLSERLANRLSWTIVGVIWGNSIFYLGAVFAPNRGLTYGDNVAGVGKLAGMIAFVPAILAAYALIVVIIIILRKVKKASH
ncbi:MAG: hypothetical protein AAFU64_17265 [Bacteroidota bacterium]